MKTLTVLKIQKWLAAAAAMMILAAGCLCPAAAEETAQDESLNGSYQVLEDGTAELIYCISDRKDITVPAEAEGRPVTAIAEDALCMCENLERVTIPDSVTVIEGNPFTICSRLKEIIVSPDHPTLEVRDGVLFSKADARLIVCPAGVHPENYAVPEGTKTIGANAFRNIDRLTTVTVPEGVEEIGDRAFWYCENLKEITLPGSLRKIGESAFAGDYNLTAFAIPEGVEEIGNNALWGCGLTTVDIPDSVTTVGNNPFNFCKELRQISVSPDHPTLEIRDGMLFSKPDSRLIYYPMGRQEDTFEIPEGTKVIGGFAFWHCENLASVTVPEGVTEIGIDAFSACRNLKNAVIPDSVTAIGEAAFFRCESLESVTIPSGVTAIGPFTFQYCQAIKEISIPDSVTVIGEWAFCDCTGLKSVVIPEGVTEIGTYAFGFCDSLTSVTIPDSTEMIEDSAFIECGEHVTFTVGRDSFAQQYCEKFGYTYECREN